MKIKQITMREDGEMKIKAVSGKDVTIDQGGTEVKTTTDALVPDANHPGGFTMKPADPNQLKPGAPVTSSDSSTSMEEETEEDDEPGHKHYNDWMHSEHSPHSDEAGDEDAIFQKAIHFLHKHGVHPGDIEYHAHHMTKKFLDEINETHHDLVSQGDQDVGGDATDNFIDQVVDKKWEKANRGPTGPGTRSPLSEKDELYKWLTIAGIK